MKFIVTRKQTDENGQAYTGQPCEEAQKEIHTYGEKEVRSTDSPYTIWKTEEEVQKNWFGIGKNHRTEKGKIVRDMEAKKNSYWVVEFNGLEDLIRFEETYGDILITDSHFPMYPIELKVIEIQHGLPEE